MDRLQITARLGGPVLRGRGRLTFDALLAAAVFEQTGNLHQAHEQLPLRRTEGLYHASAVFYEALDQRPLALVQNFRPDDLWLDPAWLKKNKQGQVHRKFSNQPDPILNSVHQVSTPELVWYCEGDADAIAPLLRHLTHVGKKRSALVTEWRCEPGELDGVMGYADEPLRPVPVALWRGDRSGPIVDAAWRPAYWDPLQRTACYVEDAA